MVGLVLMFVGGVGCAQGAVVHNYERTVSEQVSGGIPAVAPGGETVGLPGFFGALNGMAVAGHELVIGEGLQTAAGEKSRLDRFDGVSGGFERQLAAFGNAPGALGLIGGVGVGAGGVVFAGGGEVGGAAGVVGVFGVSGERLSVWSGVHVMGGSFGQGGVDVSVDDNSNVVADWAAGDVFVVNRGERAVDVLKPGGGGVEPEGEAGHLAGTCPVAGETVVGVTCSGGGPVVVFGAPRAVAVDEATGEVLVADGSVLDLFLPGPVEGTFDFRGAGDRHLTRPVRTSPGKCGGGRFRGCVCGRRSRQCGR